MTVDPYRRNLQRAYIDLLGARLTPAPAAAGAATAAALKDDSRGAIRAELKTILDLLARTVSSTKDQATKNHWNDLIAQIALVLEPKK